MSIDSAGSYHFTVSFRGRDHTFVQTPERRFPLAHIGSEPDVREHRLLDALTYFWNREPEELVEAVQHQQRISLGPYVLEPGQEETTLRMMGERITVSGNEFRELVQDLYRATLAHLKVDPEGHDSEISPIEVRLGHLESAHLEPAPEEPSQPLRRK